MSKRLMTTREIREWLSLHSNEPLVGFLLDDDRNVIGMAPTGTPYQPRDLLRLLEIRGISDVAVFQIDPDGSLQIAQPQQPVPSQDNGSAERATGQPPIQLRITSEKVAARQEGRYQVCIAGQPIDNVPWYTLPAVLDACLAFLMSPGTIGIECSDWFPAHLLWKAIDAHEWWCVETPGLGWPTNIRAVIYINGERVMDDPHPVLQED